MSLSPRVVSAALMSMLMSLFMTGWIGWLHAGWPALAPVRWGHAFLAAWPAAFVMVIVLGVPVARLVQWLVAPRRQSRA